MKDKELAKMIVDYIPFWELPHTEYKDNYKETLNGLKDKQSIQDMYNYLYEEDNNNATYIRIMNELTKRIKGVKQC